jgi:ABC-2 type transport system permease protein
MDIINKFFTSRFWALVLKEIRQILRNKQLIFLLVVPPTLQLLIYGWALNPDVHHLKLGVVDYAQTAQSRELVSAFTANQIFDAESYSFDEKILAKQVETGKLTAGLVIPPEFSRDIAKGKSTTVQVFIDGVDANTAGIANGYINQIIQQFGLQQFNPDFVPPVTTEVIFFYNPGLTSSWFFVPGVMGLVITLIGTIVSSITVVKEKDTGTLEQLLMTPSASWEILLAKVIPLFVLLMGDVLLALTMGRIVFAVPFRGNFLLFMILSGLYVFVSIGIGIMLATVCQSQQQVVLTTFFINLPMIQLSGALAPIETMPKLFQYLSLINPLRHYVTIIRGVLLKGVGLESLWIHVLALGFFAVLLLGISARRFRTQLS